MAYLKLLGIILVVVAIQKFNLQLDIYVICNNINVKYSSYYVVILQCVCSLCRGDVAVGRLDVA